MTFRLVSTRLAAAAVCALTLGAGAAHADNDLPYEASIAIDDRPNQARLIVGARTYPEVEVSRALAAQPVHPHMVQLVLGNAHSTYIDPARNLNSRNGHIDENHSLNRAQRLANSLGNVTTNDLNAMKNALAATRNPVARSNRAQLIVPMARLTVTQADGTTRVIEAGSERLEPAPKRRSIPIPAVPKPQQQDDDEKVAQHDAPTPDA